MAALLITALTTPICIAAAHRLGVVDRPGPLKVQARPVAYLGGVAVLAGLLGPAVLAMPALWAPLLAATALGLADDVADLPLRVRVAVEVGIGILVPVVVGLPAPLVPLAAVIVVALVNAVNLLDGLDGLASGVAGVAAIGFAIVLDGDPRVLALGLAGALAGFLVWNRPPARIYLGDAGSYLVGTSLGVLVATAMDRPEGAVSATAAAALLVGVPVGDMAVAILRRWRAGRPLFGGDRGHVYDQLRDRGWTLGRVVAACVTAQVALAAVAVAVAQLPAAPAGAVAALTVGAVGTAAALIFTSPGSWTPVDPPDPGQ